MKNPKECFCIHQNQTFFVLNELTPATCEDGNEPLLFHHTTFSRFKFVIISADKQAATANIPVTEFPGIFEEVRSRNLISRMNAGTKRALQNIESSLQRIAPEGESSGITVDTSSPAFTVRITAGRLRGKTPVEALLENTEVNTQMLKNQESWLTEHLRQYPKNQTQIDAIKEALRLQEKGLLGRVQEPGTTTSAAQTPLPEPGNVIYKTGCRPLVRRTRKDGKSFVYEIKISWMEGMPKPIEVEIRNYYAPVKTDEKGLLNVLAKERADEMKNLFSLSMNEWLWLEHQINTQVRTFEDILARKMYKTANDDEYANRARASIPPRGGVV